VCYYFPAFLTLIKTSASLLKRPLLTNCLSAAFLFGAGDVIAQQAIEKKGGFRGHDVRSKVIPSQLSTNDDVTVCENG